MTEQEYENKIQELEYKLQVADELNAKAFEQIVDLGSQVRYYENMLKVGRFKPFEVK